MNEIKSGASQLIFSILLVLLSQEDCASQQHVNSDKSLEIEQTKEEGTYRNHFNQVSAFTNTALPIPKGKIYYRNITGIFQQLNYGLANGFSLSIGTDIYNIIIGETPVLSLSPKYSIPIGSNYASIGYHLVHDFVENKSVGFFQLNYTIGNSDQYFTIGVNKTTDLLDPESALHLNFDIAFPLSRKFQLMLGAYIHARGQVFNAGVHMKTKYNVSYQLVLIANHQANRNFVFPLLSIFVPLNFYYRKTKMPANLKPMQRRFNR